MIYDLLIFLNNTNYTNSIDAHCIQVFDRVKNYLSTIIERNIKKNGKFLLLYRI